MHISCERYFLWVECFSTERRVLHEVCWVYCVWGVYTSVWYLVQELQRLKSKAVITNTQSSIFYLVFFWFSTYTASQSTIQIMSFFCILKPFFCLTVQSMARRRTRREQGMKHNKGPEPDQAQDVKRLSPVISKDVPQTKSWKQQSSL